MIEDGVDTDDRKDGCCGEVYMGKRFLGHAGEKGAMETCTYLTLPTLHSTFVREIYETENHTQPF